MKPFETDSDVMTRHEVFKRLNSSREVILSNVKPHIKEQMWEYIDFLLDTMIDLDFIHTMVGEEPDGIQS